MPAARSRRRFLPITIALSVALAGAALGPAAALARLTPPKVPACYSDVGACESIFIKAPIGAVKITAAPHGIFTLTGPAPLQFKTPVGCGDLGCIYNHLNWSVPNAKVLKGCDANDTTCKVQIAAGSRTWAAVLVNQNDYPKALFLLWTPPGIAEISGTVKASNCACEVKPAPGVTVTAKGAHGGGTATTGPDGTYKLDVPQGKYTITPKLNDLKFAPKERQVKVKGDVKGVNFRAKSPCEDEDDKGDSRTAHAASKESNPCQRLYNLKLSAWIPHISVADPAVGAALQDGSDYPEDAKALTATLTGGLLGTDAYPPCLGAQTLKLFADTRPDLTWRARFLGSNSATAPALGMGTVNIPLAWNSKKSEVTFRNTTVKPGSMSRQYDYQLGPSRGSCAQPVTRVITPVVRTQVTGSGSGFTIDLSWPLPFAPYEDLGDIKDFNDALVAPLTKKASDALEAKLNELPYYKDAPAPAKKQFKKYIESVAARGGAQVAITLARDLLKNGKSFLVDKTPPPIKIGKKAIEILKKQAYGSGDVRITGRFETTDSIPPFLAGSTRLTLTTSTDGFPSFGLNVSRPAGEVPWGGDQSVTVVKTNYGGAYDSLPNVINDAFAETGAERILQGGPGRVLIAEQLKILTNATPELLRAFLPPLIVGSDKQQRTLAMTFPGQRS